MTSIDIIVHTDQVDADHIELRLEQDHLRQIRDGIAALPPTQADDHRLMQKIEDLIDHDAQCANCGERYGDHRDCDNACPVMGVGRILGFKEGSVWKPGQALPTCKQSLQVAGETGQPVADEADALRAELYSVGVCATCKQEINHHKDEPFATCGCGTSEDTSGPSVLQKLRAEVAALRARKVKLEAVYEAASALATGQDWNNGTMAKTHGYRQKLIDAIRAAGDGAGKEGT